jgi:hypothetical protein
MWIDENNPGGSSSYRGYIPSSDFDPHTYMLYLEFAGPRELELDIVNYSTMLKMWRYKNEN